MAIVENRTSLQLHTARPDVGGVEIWKLFQNFWPKLFCVLESNCVMLVCVIDGSNYNLGEIFSEFEVILPE